jgi:thioesterase domain-containing protein/acyl carrier protein
MTALALEAAEFPARDGSDIELLLGIWRSVLRTDDIAADSNFFDLGGDSLLALTLFLEIEGATGKQLPITAIYDAQTVAEQAQLLAADAAPEFSPLVLLKPGDSSAPLFVFHGVGGTVVEFAALGRLIDIPGEVYAVQAQGVDGMLPPLESVEAMAELYLRAIREKQASGPYWLCGYSFGGLLAIEVARRLKAAGEEIALLFLIDSYAHPMTWPRRSLLKVRARRVGNLVLSRLKRPPQENLAVLLALAGMRLPKQTSSASDDTQLPPELRKRSWLLKTKPNLPLPLLETRLATELALSHYQPTYYAGDAMFLKARRPDPHFPTDPKYVWGKLIAQLTVQICPGSHLTIVSDHAADVAARINACIHKPSRGHANSALAEDAVPLGHVLPQARIA